MGLNRRNVLVGLGGIVAGAGALVGTGAFTTVQAERTVDVSTAGDDSALLTLDTIDDSPNSTGNGSTDGYAEIDGGTLEIEIPDVNLNAITKIDRVFQITNNGTQDVVVYLQEDPGTPNNDGNAIDFGARSDQSSGVRAPDHDDPQTVKADASDPNGQDTSNGIKDDKIADLSGPGGPNYDDLGVLLGVGDTFEVGVYIDTSDDDLNTGLNESNNSSVSGNLMDNVIIYADAEAAENDNHYFEAAETSN